MSPGWLSPRGRVLSGAGLGVLGWAIPPGLVDEAVGDGLAWEVRLRALPARLAVYFVLGLCLFSGEAYGPVLRRVTAGLEGALAAAGWALPTSAALARARRRVGEKPLEGVFRRVAGPLTAGRAPWSHVCGLLAVAWDGTTVAAQPAPANDAALGRPGGPGHRARSAAGTGSGGGAAHPQLRLVTLAACGTRALLDAAFGPVRGKGTGERELARQLLGSLRAGMLLLADRGFYSWALWNAAAATGAHLLWRASDSMHLPVARALPDGSWLTRIPGPAAARARRSKNFKRLRRASPPDTSPLPAITARVIAYAVTVTADDGTARTQRYRLITTLLDHRACPAAELAAGYARRWGIETCYLELKAALRGPRLLRARTPDLARQELWAYLAVYQAIRALICRAAARHGTDPARLSFTAALHAARRAITARGNLSKALAAAEDEILAAPVPRRSHRVSPRAVSKPLSPYPSRRARPGPISHHASYALTLTTPASPAHTTPSQHKQQEPPPANPP